jgi:hypothetical protein
VVSDPTALVEPVIVPVEDAIESPEGSEPVVTAYVIVASDSSEVAPVVIETELLPWISYLNIIWVIVIIYHCLCDIK